VLAAYESFLYALLESDRPLRARLRSRESAAA
jgi:hypothetical protein